MKSVIFVFAFLGCFSASSFQKESNSKSDFETFEILFKGRVKVNCLSSEREKLNTFFGEVLGLKVETNKKFDRVYFKGGGFVAFVYFEDPAMVLTDADFLKAMQVGLLVNDQTYEAIKQKAKTFGVKEVFPERDQSKYFYFHAPGGQVFRLVNTPKDEFEKIITH